MQNSPTPTLILHNMVLFTKRFIRQYQQCGQRRSIPYRPSRWWDLRMKINRSLPGKIFVIEAIGMPEKWQKHRIGQKYFRQLPIIVPDEFERIIVECVNNPILGHLLIKCGYINMEDHNYSWKITDEKRSRKTSSEAILLERIDDTE